ncbi:hypothetical protein L207DRAFT_20817 [Hyaloscypha variabilis F]|uniref:Uncharacterized protein n=1 Tax=Hyaloscypha variabilis (strain UAMH 11265 / GT02V1 / F) TaxID=1149755 RepID=A0A2J6SEB2_HYAVF|nr:hypothetical protein L207DRAFT_20817 [Hyaloscypha variabilis F]
MEPPGPSFHDSSPVPTSPRWPKGGGRKTIFRTSLNSFVLCTNTQANPKANSKVASECLSPTGAAPRSSSDFLNLGPPAWGPCTTAASCGS